MSIVYTATCIDKHRDSQGRIKEYTLKFSDEHEDTFITKSLRDHMQSGRLYIDNLKFNTKGRLITKEIDAIEKEIIISQGQDIINLMIMALNTEITEDPDEDANRIIVIPVFYKPSQKLQPEGINKYTSNYLVTPITNLLQSLKYKITTHNLQKVLETLIHHVIGIMNNKDILIEHFRSYSLPAGEYEFNYFQKSALNSLRETYRKNTSEHLE